jgi:hypothetical protein
MSRLTFNYQLNYRPLLSESEGRKTLTVPLPVIEIALSHNGLTTTDLALIDSGSTYSLFSREIADELEIEVLQGRMQRLATLGGPLQAYGHEVEIEIIPHFRYRAEVLFAEYPIPRNLFGHTGFLNHFSIALRSRFGLIYFNPEI